MDQDSFRQMLQTPRAGGPAVLGGGPRARIAVPTKAAPKATVDASQPTFKPRTVKKNKDSKYRDRASERRTGDGNDFAQVEAVLEEFEKRNANEEDKAKVEAQRKYLGGDSQHSVLVKGLDFALLEQNKAKSLITEDDVDALDAAFLESSTHPQPAAPKKRTREELIAELKAKREGGGNGVSASASPDIAEEARKLEEAKQKGKFKPIGFKPIGASSETKKKKKKVATDGADGEKKLKKKKKKEKAGAAGSSKEAEQSASTSALPPVAASTAMQKEPEDLEPPNDDFDIFADVGEYEGLADDADDDEDDAAAVRAPTTSRRTQLEEGEEVSPPPDGKKPFRIFEDDRETFEARKSPEPQPKASSSSRPSRETREPTPPYHHLRPPISDDEDESMDEGRPMRLVPLSGSAIPSIKDLLAMDKAAESQAKNRKRKLKKSKDKGGDDDDDDGDESDSKKKSLEEKVDRDYKRLKTYTEKKSAGEGK